MVRANSAETGRRVKLVCNSLWSVRQGKKKRVKRENLTKCINLEEYAKTGILEQGICVPWGKKATR